MFRKWSLLISAAVAVFTLLSLFFVNRAEDTVLAMKSLELAESGSTEIALSTLTDFVWEKAAVYGPYTTVDSIEGSLNIEKGSSKAIDYTGSSAYVKDRFLNSQLIYSPFKINFYFKTLLLNES